MLVPTAKLAGALLVITTFTHGLVADGAVNTTFVAAQSPKLATANTSAFVPIVGGRVLVTTTFCTHVALLPAPSHAVHTTWLVPPAYCEGALLVSDTTVQLSVAVALPRPTLVAKHELVSGPTNTSGGQVIVGNWKSSTKT